MNPLFVHVQLVFMLSLRAGYFKFSCTTDKGFEYRFIVSAVFLTLFLLQYIMFFIFMIEHFVIFVILLFPLQAIQDTTVVIEDYTATSPREVSVLRGQQVEIIDASPGQVDWCLVRTLPPDGADSSQGLVPMSVLRPMSYLQTPGARNSMDLDGSYKYHYFIILFFSFGISAMIV